MKGIRKMKKTINVMLAGLLCIPMLALAVSFVAPVTAHAADCNTSDLTVSSGANCSKGTGTPTDLFNGDNSIFKNVTNAALFLIGAVSVLMLIYGGIRYTVSGGDTKQVTDAKNTILYAVVGIVVAIMAYAIVNFVIGRLTTGA
jgi:hypothetical protein